MFAIEFHDLDEHQLDEDGLRAKLVHGDHGGISQKILSRLPFRLKDHRQDLSVWMLINDDGFEYFFLARKVIIDAAQGQPGMFRNLPHGCGMIAMLHEQFHSSILDLHAGDVHPLFAFPLS